MKTQRSLGETLLAVLCSLLVLFALFVSAVQFGVLQNIPFYLAQYQSTGAAAKLSLGAADQTLLTEQMVAYLTGKTDALQTSVSIYGETRGFFSERELLHMQDVQAIFLWLFAARTVAIVFVGLVIAVCFVRNKAKWILPAVSIFRKTCLGVFLGALLLTLLSAIDFNTAFRLFHQLLFHNTYWMLSAATDKLVVLLPKAFFVAAALRIAMLSLASIAMVGFLPVLLAHVTTRRKMRQTK